MSGDALDALATRADGIAGDPEASAAPGAAGAQPAEEAQPTNYGTIVAGLTIVRELAVNVLKFESPKETLSSANIEIIATNSAPAFDKNNIKLWSVMSGYEIEAQAVMVAGPVVWAAVRQAMYEMKARSAKPVRPDEEPPAGGDGRNGSEG